MFVPGGGGVSGGSVVLGGAVLGTFVGGTGTRADEGQNTKDRFKSIY